MRKHLFLLFALLLNFGLAMAAGTPRPVTDTGSAYTPCNIVITGDFDSECIYDYKDEITDEYPNLMIACKHSRVTYTCYASVGGSSPVSYNWSIMGDVHHTASGNHVTVDWGDDGWGMVIVTVVNAAGDTCSDVSRVKLIDNPVVGSWAVPGITVLEDGRKVIRVCKGGSIQFMDASDAGESDIAGYHWESEIPTSTPSSTPNYTIEGIDVGGKVIHRVYNNCGCYDEEVIEVELLEGEILELDCYGAVCKGEKVTYNLTAPECDEYSWYVEGGVLIDGQGTKNPVVQWDNPESGYGVIGLDGVLCGDIACPTMMMKRVAVIGPGRQIEGDVDVCQGESVVYRLPLMGSTVYNWTVTPYASGAMYNVFGGQSNEIRVTFDTPGTYVLSCTYECDFLSCGPWDAESITIKVRPKFDIDGDEEICVTNACTLQTLPVVNAHWVAYDIEHGNNVAVTSQGTSFAHTFSQAGRYLITAENPSYCGPATFVLTVKDVPEAPTVDDLSSSNLHYACPNSGIVLSGTPSAGNYSLVWEPECTSATPQQYSGDSVTISYASEVCDVRVYNYDRVLGCKSNDFYVHEVSPLTPLTTQLPHYATACPNSTIPFIGLVPDQSAQGVLYEWKIQTSKQHCAAVMGSHLMPNITLMVNNVATPESFYVVLYRYYCNTYTTDTVFVDILNPAQHTLTISGPSSLCAGDEATFTGNGGNSNTYSWDIENHAYSGSSATHTFYNPGTKKVTLTENPYTYCTNPEYLNRQVKIVTVNPLPLVKGLKCNNVANTVSVDPLLSYLDYTFNWTFQPDHGSAYGIASHLPTIAQQNHPGTYTCTVINRQTGCSTTVTGSCDCVPVPTCDSMPLLGTYDPCSHSITLTASHYPTIVGWDVDGGSATIHTSGTNRRTAEITFNSIGYFTVYAQSGWLDNCYAGRREVLVDFIPDFELTPKCNKVEITNNSLFANSNAEVYIHVTRGTTYSADIHFPVSQGSYTFALSSSPFYFLGGTYTFTLTGYGTNGNLSCPLGSVTLGSTLLPFGTDAVSISTANPYSTTTTCDNTPIELTATLGYVGSIVSSTWNFGDSSSYHLDGNSVYHTFASAGTYPVTVTVTDNRGCTASSPVINITSYGNPLQYAQLQQLDAPKCPNATPTVRARFSNTSSANHYTWWTDKQPIPVIDGNPHYTPPFSDLNHVSVVNNNYCHKEATKFITYLNAPAAFIYAENYNVCEGDEVKLYGNQGPSTIPVNYQWTVTNPYGYQVYQSTDPDIHFTPAISGNYTVTLNVSSTAPGGCSSSATETIHVNPRPAAPTISFVGTQCISNAPVHLQASGYSGEVHWSNGNSGPDAYYNTHGLVSAYYYDPAIGCNSYPDTIRIAKQPDFDALLTGCYERCKDFFLYNLPVYGLTDDMQFIKWKWFLNGNVVASSNYGNYTYSPLQLPLVGFGDYELEVSLPNDSCAATSPVLHISESRLCDCDSVSVKYEREMALEDCHLIYTYHVTVCNESFTKICFSKLEPLALIDEDIKLLDCGFNPVSIDPHDCITFDIKIEVLDLLPNVAGFKLINCSGTCEKYFELDLTPEKLDCMMDMEMEGFDVLDFSSHVAAYFNFTFHLGPTQNLLAFWSEPPMVRDYHYDEGAEHVDGFGMLDYNTLTQMALEDGKVCFYAITCEGDQLCYKVFCIRAQELLDKLSEYGIEPKFAAQSPEETDDWKVRLMPNPTSGECSVVSGQCSVESIVVMDVNGRKMATFEGTTKFDISTLPSGLYIVRIISASKDGSKKSDYMKLIKK